MIKKIVYIVLICCSFQVFSQTDLNVMSYNIRLGSANDGENNWDIRKEKVSDLLNYYEASFIGLQEAQKFQLDFILKNLPNYDYIGLPRESGELAEYSCILYNKSEYKLMEQKTIWLSKTPDSISKGWDAACFRIVTYGLFKNKKSGKQFWIANTHFDHLGKEARYESAKLIANLSNELISKKDIPFILTGDFNSTYDENTIQLMVENFNDSKSESETKPYGGDATWNAFDFKSKPSSRIDYIFYDRFSKIKVRKFITITDFYDFKYPSDHFPIMATFKFN